MFQGRQLKSGTRHYMIDDNNIDSHRYKTGLGYIKNLVSSLSTLEMPKKEALNNIEQIKSEHYYTYGKSILSIVNWYLIAILVVVLLDGFGVRNWDRFHLSDPVMVVILSTTTVNVLGLMYIVVRHLFPSAHSDNKEQKKVDPDTQLCDQQ